MCFDSLSKAEITAAFEKLQKAGAVKMNPALAGLNDELIPVLDKTAEPQLEVIQPKPVAKEVNFFREFRDWNFEIDKAKEAHSAWGPKIARPRRCWVESRSSKPNWTAINSNKITTYFGIITIISLIWQHIWIHSLVMYILRSNYRKVISKNKQTNNKLPILL